jgi:Ca2+:H+ antiporter
VGRRLTRAALVLTPVALIARYALEAGSTVVFVLAAVALAPLAFLIGEATESVSRHTGPAIGAFVNASLGNAPELIIALFAVSHGLPTVVLGSITGSIVSTSLLVCGGAMLAGGHGLLPRRSLLVQVGTALAAVALFLVPAVPGFHGDPGRHDLYLLTLPVAAVLLCVYVVVTFWNLRREQLPERPQADSGWSLRRSLATLAAAAAATAVVSELLVDSLQQFGRSLGLSQLLVAAVIVALVGNAAEQGGAVVVARRGNPGLGVEIAISSSTQIAVFVCPAVALLSGATGHDLPLSFLPVELALMAAAGVAVVAAVVPGRSSRPVGLALIVAYGVAVAALVLAPGR